jgi:hypothetical protein
MRRGLPGFRQAARRFPERLDLLFAFAVERLDPELRAQSDEGISASLCRPSEGGAPCFDTENRQKKASEG